jgi:aminopeptidase N
MRPAITWRAPIATLFVACGLALPASAPGSATFVNGSRGLGDDFFPRSGNGGYDVAHYDLRLRYGPGSGRLVARAHIRATATQNLKRFDLDYRGPRITGLRVDGASASFSRAGQELVVRPRSHIADGDVFRVRVDYRGRPHSITDPDGSVEGWVRTDDGAFVVGEPRGSPTWFPCNDFPTDKARFDFRVSVPRGTTAVANGELVKRIRRAHRAIFMWSERRPMATYLATVTTGIFDVTRSHHAGIPIYVAVDPREGPAPALGRLGDVLDLFASKFSAYPFEAGGAIVDSAPGVGYSLETQTRPLFDQAPDEILLAHEVSHQWFGDSVSLKRWRHMWLNEGFATFSEWYWDESDGGQTVAQRFDDLYATPGSNSAFWDPPPARPGSPAHLFDNTIYVRGGMALQALREKVGDPTFFEVLHDWATTHRYGNATIRDFIDLAESKSGLDLGPFFNAWLYEPGKPTTW